MIQKFVSNYLKLTVCKKHWKQVISLQKRRTVTYKRKMLCNHVFANILSCINYFSCSLAFLVNFLGMFSRKLKCIAIKANLVHEFYVYSSYYKYIIQNANYAKHCTITVLWRNGNYNPVAYGIVEGLKIQLWKEADLG